MNNLSKKEAAQLAMRLDLDQTELGRQRVSGCAYRAGSAKRAPLGLFESLCEAHGLPVPVPEYTFAPPRKWRFDWLFEGWLALEIEGGVHTQGRHTRARGFLCDMEKYNNAAILGFVVLRCTPQDVSSGAAFALIRRGLEGQEEQP